MNMATNRPTTLAEFTGQENLKPLIQGIIDKCNETHKPWPHTLCFGPPGVGKTTLSQCINSGLTGYTFISLTASKDWTPDTLRRIRLDLPIEGYSKVTNDGAWIPGAPKYMPELSLDPPTVPERSARNAAPPASSISGGSKEL